MSSQSFSQSFSQSLSQSALLGLKSAQFRHPLDLQATQTLQKLPGLDLLIRSLLGPVAERFFYLENLASGILVSDRQLPNLHQALLEACTLLDLEPPQLYIRQNPAPNAYTFAMRGKQPFIVLHSSLIDLLTPAEVQAVIAHELGHLKCEHSVYLTIANLLLMAAGQLLPFGTVVTQNFQARLMEWVRCAEFSCDRAALLVVQDPRVVASVLMKLSGGSPAIAPLLNLDAFLEQARAYEAIDTDELGKMLKQIRTAPLSHPVPVLRAKEIDRWAGSPEFQLLLQNYTMPYTMETSELGGWRNW